MKERPILFSAEMVRAILAGRKTQTRRVIKPQPVSTIIPDARGHFPVAFWQDNNRWVKPPYQPGMALWVREAWGTITKGTGFNAYDEYVYKANYSDGDKPCDRWRPSIHMPRAASRATLEVVSVQVERLQDISEADAMAEGLRIGMGGSPFFSCQDAYRSLWDSLNAKRGYGWDVNPWVFVIEFRRAI